MDNTCQLAECDGSIEPTGGAGGLGHEPLRATGLCDRCGARYRQFENLGWVLQDESDSDSD